jgi:hypothetical protein
VGPVEDVVETLNTSKKWENPFRDSTGMGFKKQKIN